MVETPNTQTLARSAIFFGDLEETVKKYSTECRQTRSILGNTIQYGLYQTQPSPYLFMVSKQKDNILVNNEYNLLLTVTSDFSETNRLVVERFRETTGINLVEPSAYISQHFQFLNNILPIMKKHGDRAMDVLNGGLS